MPRYGATLQDRADYRRDLQHAAERGGVPFLRFLERNRDLWAPVEWTRIRFWLRAWGDNIATFVDHRFRYLRGRPCDPHAARADQPGYPTIVETLITPHKFLAHLL